MTRNEIISLIIHFDNQFKYLNQILLTVIINYIND